METLFIAIFPALTPAPGVEQVYNQNLLNTEWIFCHLSQNLNITLLPQILSVTSPINFLSKTFPESLSSSLSTADILLQDVIPVQQIHIWFLRLYLAPA